MKTRILSVQLSIGLWFLIVIASIVSFRVTEATGDGFLRGLNQIAIFLFLQAVAGLVALGVWQLGKGLPEGSPLRQISRVPLWVLGSLGILLVALIVLAISVG